MNDRRLIETDFGSPSGGTTPVSQQGLPEDLLREASHRLGYTAFISGGLWLRPLASYPWSRATSKVVA